MSSDSTAIGRTVFRAKVVALLLLLVYAPYAWAPDIFATLQSFRRLPFHIAGAAIYLLVVAWALAGFVIAPFLRNTALRVIFISIFLAGYAVDRIVLATSGAHVDGTMLQIFWQDRTLAPQVLRDQFMVIGPHTLLIAAIGVLLAWPLRMGFRSALAVIPALAVPLVSLHFAWWGGMLTGYPGPFLVPARIAWILTAPPTHSQLTLKPVALPLADEPPAFEKIVVVMDESVRGDYLSINNPAIGTTPVLQQAAGRIVNFGVATSGSNCSYQSRWMFRRGVRPWQLPDRPSLGRSDEDGIVTGPRTTLWQFAKAAGYKTIYVDPWTASYGAEHSGLTDTELALVDERQMLNGTPYLRDIEAARLVGSVLARKERLFIHVDKFGVHFPYDDDTPPDFNRFARADGTRFDYYRKTADDLEGSYKNAVAWSVDGFFGELLKQADLRNVLVLYTSDHGEDLSEATLWHHCDTNPPASELWVPLFAFAGSEPFEAALRASAARSFNEATHFDIFPTLLVAMGYDSTRVQETYGSNLMNIPKDRPRRFIIGDVNGREYRVWLDVNETGARLRDRLANGCLTCLWR
jgi:hypothetical protein